MQGVYRLNMSHAVELKIIRKRTHTMKKTNKKTNQWNILVYIIIGVVGSGLIFASFFACGNWSNILSGIGIGLLTSLFVSILIEEQLKRDKEKKKMIDIKLFLADIFYVAEDTYIDILDRMNEFLFVYYKHNNWLSGLYDDESKYAVFLEKVASIDHLNATMHEKIQIDTLLNINNYRIDGLIQDLNKLPKLQLYLSGILSIKEYENIGKIKTEFYTAYIKDLPKYWDYEVIDLKMCVKLTKTILYICTEIIKSFNLCKISVANKEIKLLDDLNEQFCSENI